MPIHNRATRVLTEVGAGYSLPFGRRGYCSKYLAMTHSLKGITIDLPIP